MRKSIGEILEQVNAESTKKGKADILRENNNNSLVAFLNEARGSAPWAYENRPLPPIIMEDPPEGYSEDNLSNQLRRLYIFREGALDPKRQDELIVQMAESLTEKEAEILLKLVQGKSPAKGLTERFLDDLFNGKI